MVGLGIEFFFAQKRGHEVNEGFLVSGLLIPMIMPVGTPLWMIALGTDVDHNRIVAVFIIFFFPDFFKQPLRTDDLPTVVTQQPEDIKLNRC